MNKKMVNLCSIAVLAVLFSACGGGASTTSTADSSSDTNSNNSELTITGQALNTYIEGAKVCLDVNNNLECDEGEPSTMTGKYGQYTLKLSSEERKLVDGKTAILLKPTSNSIVVNKAGQTEKPFTKTFLAIPSADTKELSNRDVPLTMVSTLVAKYAKDKGVSIDDQELKSEIQNKIGIDLDKKVNYSSDKSEEALRRYKLNKILLAAADANIPIDDFVNEFEEKSGNINDIIEDVIKEKASAKDKDKLEKLTDYYNSLDEKALGYQDAISDAISKKEKEGDNNFSEIDYLALTPDPIFFLKSDLVGNTYVMYSADTNKPFMHDVMGDLTFNEDGTISSTTAGSMDYSIDENGQLIMGAHGTYKKVEEKDGKIYFESIASGKKYYFVKKEVQTPPSTNKDFVKSDLVGNTYVMYSADTNKPFMYDVMGDLTFNEDGTISSTVAGSMNYSIDENGQLIMGAHGTYKKVEEKDGKIYFESITSGRKYYFVKKGGFTPTPNVAFKKTDLVGKTFSMHKENGDIFMGLSKITFKEDDTVIANGTTMSYSIVDGILTLHGTFRKLEEKDGKIWFESTEKPHTKYYFQKEAGSDNPDTSDDNETPVIPEGTGEPFTYDDFVGKTYNMYLANGTKFEGPFSFTEDKVTGKSGTPRDYKIEDGILKLMNMSFERIALEDGKLWFKSVPDGTVYYFQASTGNEEPEESIETEGVLLSAYKNRAIIFLDTNKNLTLDTDEPRTQTDVNGNFRINIPESALQRKSLVAINGRNGAGEVSKDILFATPMSEAKVYINTFSSFLTSLAHAITGGKIQQSDISHSNMIPSLGATLDITIGLDGSVNQLEADPTKDVGINKKALKLNAYVRAIANTYNSGKSNNEKILEAYVHLISNAISNTPRLDENEEPVDETGIVHLIERFNEKNTLENEAGETFASLLEKITNGIDNNLSNEEIEALIEKAKEFRPEKKKEAQSWEVSFDGKVLLPKDQFSKYQWHIKDQGAIVNTHGIFTTGYGDLGVMELYKKGYVGKNAYVRVVDDGVEASHEDLKARVDVNNSYNAQTKENDPTSPQIEDSHGTNVAGLIAADGSNNIGLRGVAPYATLSAYKLRTPQAGSLDYDYDELTEAWLGGNDEISIVNNSWGSTIDKYIEEERLLEKGATQKRVRNGKALGRIYLIASGNGGFNQRDNEDDDILDVVDDSNTSYFRGSQYALTVAAVRNENIVTQYSTQGSNVLVSGYGGGIKTHTSALMGTTTRTGATRETWEEDSKKAYSFTFDGTSAATPVVSGALALVLSECPDLSYRDVKWLIAHTAKKIDENYDGKTISGVKNVPSYKTAPKLDLDQGFGYIGNSAGLSHSNYYGYGLVNPAGMIEKCKGDFKPLPEKRTVKVINENTSLTNLKNSENHLLTEKITINTSDLQGDKKIDKIEWVGLTVYGHVDNLTKISMVLISPSGTVSRILTNSKTAFDDVAILEEGYRFSSVAFVDEDPKGEWTLLVQSSDDEKEDTGRLTKLELEVVGYNSEDRK